MTRKRGLLSLNIILPSIPVFGILMATTGCLAPGQTISTASAKPWKAEFDFHNAEIVEDRYLIIEIAPEDQNKAGVLSFGSVSIANSAWSGLYFGFPSQRQLLNLRIVDLQERTTRTVFDRQVAMGGWTQSLSSKEHRKLRFKNVLFFAARADDTTGDQQIDWDDASTVFSYDLDTGNLRRLSPSGYNALRYDFLGNRLLVALEKQEERGVFSIYESNPVSGEGTFVVEGMEP